jgi:RNA polymerase sigma factor (sigma-70 family)
VSGAELADRLVANHRAFLAFLERRVGSRAEAEDLLQEAFVKSLESASTLRDEESVVAWFYRTLRNTVIDHHRRRAAAARTRDAFARELETAEAPAEVQAVICECLGELAATLKPEYAEAIRRVDLGGSSVQAYAAEAGIGASNAGVRLHRAREALRKRVRQSCGSCAEHGCLDCSCTPTA